MPRREPDAGAGTALATSLFFSAGVGVGAGLGYPILEGGSTLLALATLRCVLWLEEWFQRRGMRDD